MYRYALLLDACRAWLQFKGRVVVRAGEQSERFVSGNHVAQEAVEKTKTLVRNAVGEGRRVRFEAEDFAERPPE